MKKVVREEAASLIAERMNMNDIVPLTIQRLIPTPDGEVNAAVQVYWDPPPTPPPADLASLRDEDVWRVACFDAVISQTDRGGNWGRSTSDDGPVLPLLFDHGNTFGQGAVGSPFYDAKRGMEVPDDLREALADLQDWLPTSEVKAQLPSDEYEALETRVSNLVRTGKLDLI